MYSGTVKKAALLKIVHMKYPANKKLVEAQINALHQDLAEAININKDISNHLNKGQVSPLSYFAYFLYHFKETMYFNNCNFIQFLQIMRNFKF